MRIFLTGGTGFIGRRLVPMLAAKGHTLLLLSRTKERTPVPSSRKTPVLKGDLSHIARWYPALKRFKPEAAIHLAWEGIPNPDFKLCMRNLNAGLALIEALGRAKCRTVIVAGSGHEYGEPGVKVNERFPLNPFNMLYAAKAALYFLGSKIAEAQGMRMVWARLFFVYGPGQRAASLIPYLVRMLRDGKAPTLRNPRGGNDFVYVDDVARALAMLAEKKTTRMNEIYNIGGGRLIGVNEIARKLYRALKISMPRELVRKQGRPTGFYADISKIRRDIGWKPRVSIDEGIQRTIRALLTPVS